MEISSENLLSLINDVLDFSKMEEGKIAFSERDIDIKGFLKNLKLANKVRSEEKGIALKVMLDDEIPTFIKGDDLRLGQILNNLISNAVKFTKNGTITITATLHKQTEEFVELYFEVADTGIGIPEEKQNLIFERFTQANNNITREYGGSGLGLTIIKRLLILQGSDIQLSSVVGVGSKFFFYLKFKPSDAEFSYLPETKFEEKPDLNGITILLVEDVEFNIFVAEMMLKNWNAKVEKSENGLAAVAQVQNNHYDLILMDIQMPVMDGYTATNEIRKFNTTTPIIALTASLSIDILDKANEVGMNGFITKPFNPNDLYSIIKKNIKLK
jgi:CheY-like chemotaxis protein/two-component sensor histidine kinase